MRIRRAGHLVVAAVVAFVAITTLGAGPAHAARPVASDAVTEGPTVSGVLTGPTERLPGQGATYRWVGQPQPSGEQTRDDSYLEVRSDGGWLRRPSTGLDHPEVYTFAVGTDSMTIRATETLVDADGALQSVHSEPLGITVLHPRTRFTGFRAPHQVRDGARATITFAVANRSLAALPVTAELQTGTSGSWHTVRRLRTSRNGSWTVRPRVTTTYRVAVTDRFGHQITRETTILNRPIGVVVVLPPSAPAPQGLPAQPRVLRPGPAVRSGPIPSPVWRRMQGRSWHPGCLARSRLRYLRVTYWGFDGYPHRGELVVAATVAARVGATFAGLFARRVPIRSMYLPDRFGYSARVRGADDYASMAHDNTSAFNCRWVVGRPGVLSPHASGRAVDLNPWENPYDSPADGWVPDAWWRGRRRGSYAWNAASDLVPTIFRAHGGRWTYGRADEQHFDF